MKSQTKIYLASKSPTRLRILKEAGFDPIIVESSYDEPEIPGLSANELAKRHAFCKTKEIVVPHKSGVVVGCDTISVSNGIIFGKPENKAHAKKMLKRHSGNIIEVITGLSVRNLETDQVFTCTNTSLVKFATISDAEIQWYLNSGEWEGKSGAFSISGIGSRFVKSIRGDHMAIQGLPVSTLHRCLLKWGCAI